MLRYIQAHFSEMGRTLAIYVTACLLMAVGTPASAKVILVTGAFSGLGLELSKEFLAQGHTVILSGRDLAKAPDISSFKNGENAMVLALDLGNESTLAPALSEVIRRFGRLDVLVHNASQTIQDEGPDISTDSLRRSLQVNFLGAAELTNLAMAHFERQRYGRVVYISSAASVVLQPGMSPYSTSKAAAETHFKTLALELGEHARRTGMDIDVSIMRIGVVRANYSPTIQAEPHGSGNAVSANLMAFLRSVSTTTPASVARTINETIEKKNANRFINVGFDGKILTAMSLVPASFTTTCTRILTALLPSK